MAGVLGVLGTVTGTMLLVGGAFFWGIVLRVLVERIQRWRWRRRRERAFAQWHRQHRSVS